MNGKYPPDPDMRSIKRSPVQSGPSCAGFIARPLRQAGRIVFLLALLSSTPGARLHAQLSPEYQAMNRPVPPFRLISTIYYVGASDVTSYLITTTAGHILLDSGFEETVPQIEANIAALGFNLSDVRILLVTHAHLDHAGGMSALKQKTGAILITGAPDSISMERGGKGDFQYGDRLRFKPVHVDRAVRDNDTVELGGIKVAAHLTPGHTRGCVTWTMTVQDGGGTHNVVFLGGLSSPGYRLVSNTRYPDIVQDFLHTFSILKNLPCDVFLGGHASFFAMGEKRQRLGEGTNPFIVTGELQRFVERAEKEFLDKCRHQHVPAALLDNH